MRVFIRVLLATAILLVVGAASFLWSTRIRRAEYATCERELKAMVPKLEAYAGVHKGLLPNTEEELTKALGKPLPSRYYMMRSHRTAWLWCGTGSQAHFNPQQPYIIDRNPHRYVIDRLIPFRRIHMLLTDGTVYRASSYKDLT
jgi:hypothetical protein